MKGKNLNNCPKEMYVSPDLWDAFSGEIKTLQRFTPIDHDPGYQCLMFKATKLIRMEESKYPKGSGWHLFIPEVKS